MKFLAKVVRSNNGTPQFEIKYQEHPYRVKLFKFQENYPDDSTIKCTFTRQANGALFFRQDLPALINEYFNVGEVYEFTVKHDFSHNGYYELLDERGIPFRLAVPKGMKLLTGSTVRCRLIDVDQSGGQLRLEDTDALFNAADTAKPGSKKSSVRKELDAPAIANRVFADLYPETDPEWDPDLLFELLFINDDFYEQAVSRGILDFIRSWRADHLDWHEIDLRLLDMRQAIMYVLEGSDTLLSADPLRRKSLQHRLTILANNVSGYHRAANYLAEDRQTEKVDRVLRSLSTSGYIYEAERQLDMMMRIFSLASDVMVENMNQIFNIIHARSEDFWRDEPFRKAFIRLLQMYVEQSAQAFNSGTADHDQSVRNLIEAISIQLLLADRNEDADLFDYNLNMATLYRYASMLRTSVPANALRNAFLALMDVTRRPAYIYRWNDTGAHDLMASKLTASPIGLEGGFEKWYTNRHVVLTADSEGITLSRSDVDPESIKPLELPGIGVWQTLNILTPQKIARPVTADLRRARDMWNAIETSLFSEDLNIKRPLPQRRMPPSKDDDCFIRITHQISDTLFGAEITNDSYEGRGTIAIEDMVKYKVPGLKMEHFLNDNGNPAVFKVKVKKVEEDNIIFSAYENLVRFSHDNIENDNELICVIKSSNQYGIVGVSEWGDAVRFKREGPFANIHVGEVVYANYWTRPDNPNAPYIDGVITRIADTAFNTESAFRELILGHSGENEYIAPVAEHTSTSDTASGEEMISDQRVRELMALVERQAALESDYMKAYNHIGFARLLARMARCDERREFYEAWMRLISILHHFAINGKIDDAQLAEFEANDRSRFDNRSELYRRYLQLKIVSYKGMPHMREQIWRHMADEDEEIRSLASNVMAYNLIAENASASALGEIEDRINNILHVNARKSTLHAFGAENKTTEFKSSLIFPPNNHMRANPEVQTVEIMKELCALLNADGGTLYLGVNDFGMGIGIENDLAYRDFNGSEDKYDLYFRRSVCTILGKDVDAYVDAKFETFGGKRIYIVSVKPYYTSPVRVEGIIYERHGSSKLPFHDIEDIRRFTERRAEERARQQRVLTQTSPMPVSTPQAPAQPATANPASEAEISGKPEQPQPLNPQKTQPRNTP
ncbi:MAG: putative DNA binding domain-containing protein, partial [Muribaculaceae bacterium]|nr:putative DNA binding domain-containing protein [Muribaculaceae bacterium]